MKNRKQAFTLTELLIALGIIGAIAAISIPSLMTTINNRVLTNQLKSTVGAIQQLMNDEMVTNNTKSLKDTDFADPAKLIGKPSEPSAHFATTRICNTAALSQKECWKTTATGAAKVQYRLLNGNNAEAAGPTYYSVVLKNGAILGYTLANGAIGTNDKAIGEFCVDVNGTEPPNMRGRDYFCFYVSNKGRIVDLIDQTITTEAKINSCKGTGGDANNCFGAIVDSGWKMPY